MDTSIWDVVKTIVGWAWIPLGVIMTWLVKDYTGQKDKIDSVEDRLTKLESTPTITKDLETRVIVLEVEVTGVKAGLARVEEGVNKLVDRLISDKK